MIKLNKGSKNPLYQQVKNGLPARHIVLSTEYIRHASRGPLHGG